MNTELILNTQKQEAHEKLFQVRSGDVIQYLFSFPDGVRKEIRYVAVRQWALRKGVITLFLSQPMRSIHSEAKKKSGRAQEKKTVASPKSPHTLTCNAEGDVMFRDRFGDVPSWFKQDFQILKEAMPTLRAQMTTLTISPKG